MALGDNLKRLRKERGLTQGELSELCGIKLAHISKLERSESDPKLTTIEKLIRALDCSADRLLFDKSSCGIDGWLRHSLEAATALPVRDKAALIEIIDKYALANQLNNLMLGTLSSPYSKTLLEEDQKDERQALKKFISPEESSEAP